MDQIVNLKRRIYKYLKTMQLCSLIMNEMQIKSTIVLNFLSYIFKPDLHLC